MRTRDKMTKLEKASAMEFGRYLLPLIHGPFVNIRISPDDHEYKVSKGLLCTDSKYFSAMFEPKFSVSFKEGKEQSATLKAIKGVLSTSSFEALLQWIYLRTVRFEAMKPKDEISAAIELARLGDMCMVTGLESEMANRIKEVITANPSRRHPRKGDVDINSHCLEPCHFKSIAFLPRGHKVRQILAAASVDGYLRDGGYRFLSEVEEDPELAVEILKQVRKTMAEVPQVPQARGIGRGLATATDPLTGRVLDIVWKENVV
ncbi:hypothetical protein N7466_004636 [Penicillium verhagenii]|uniref:uncharacterized protein n=1 Tax=Penicillium verhagenii TaxID=1562060 RepID=UPI002544D49E|nr:uncharacterized protein N7466_004636 [Penicillium verhagenii]KAJ5935089.1 hypothetical protein N7466_004636 [Penicillium verhagenii]